MDLIFFWGLLIALMTVAWGILTTLDKEFRGLEKRLDKIEKLLKGRGRAR